VAGKHLCPDVVRAFESLYTEGQFTVANGERVIGSLSARLDREYNRW
jgi:hypothetical protein